jgi:hypothetical protein
LHAVHMRTLHIEHGDGVHCGPVLGRGPRQAGARQEAQTWTIEAARLHAEARILAGQILEHVGRADLARLAGRLNTAYLETMQAGAARGNMRRTRQALDTARRTAAHATANVVKLSGGLVRGA